eukprot:scaffold16464_cov117-Skeletonema_marinoi.AAC.2
MNLLNITSIICIVSILLNQSEAGPITCAACYTACNAGYVTCMTSSGLIAGTTGPVGMGYECCRRMFCSSRRMHDSLCCISGCTDSLTLIGCREG